jgi:cytochrome c2
MLNSLQNSVRLLSLCAILLIITILVLLLWPENSNKITIKEERNDSLIVKNEPDPSKMDSAQLANYSRIKEGEKLFKEAGCFTCHDVCKKKVGPALRGVTKRRDREWIYKAVTNFSALLASGDKTAKELLDEYKAEMPVQTFLKREELDQILYYIDSSQCDQKETSVSVAQ